MKFLAPILIPLWALSIGQVAARRGMGGDGNNNANAASDSSTSVAAASSTAAAAVASSSAATGTTDAASSGTSNEDASVTCLQADALQTGSDSAGSITESGQASSATDPANFINFCAGETLTNGEQVQAGSCNGIPMGKIPSTSNMISTVITFPTGSDSDNLDADTSFTIRVKTSNLDAGTFTNPDTTYYSAPQDLDSSGLIIGHTHVTVQDTGGSLPTSPLDAGTFAFFKGINTGVDENGELTADVTSGLPAGFYRLCTMTSAANHQPVLMPIAQRGAQDDCRYFSVGGVGAGDTTASSESVSSTTDDDSTTTASLSSSSSAAATSTASTTTTDDDGNTSGKGSGNGGRRGGRGRGRFMGRAYVA